MDTIYGNFSTLDQRVQQDVRKRNEAQEKAKRERRERFERLRKE